MKADLTRPSVLAALSVLLLAACEPGVEGGYDTVVSRDAPVVPVYEHPDPPEVTPGSTVGAPATRIVAARLPEGVTQEMVDEGQQLYGGVCVGCHGQNGMGSPAGPQLSDDQWIHIAGEYDQIANIITTGVPNAREFPGMMPPRGGGSFDDAQVRSIAAYVYALSHQGGS